MLVLDLQLTMTEFLPIHFQQSWAIPEKCAVEVSRNGTFNISLRHPVAALSVVAVPASRHLAQVQRPLHVLNAHLQVPRSELTFFELTHPPYTYTPRCSLINSWIEATPTH